MNRPAQRCITDEPTVIKELDRIRLGRRVSVSFTQQPFFTVACVTGRWFPREMPHRFGWAVFGGGDTMAIIMPTDKIQLLAGPHGKLHLRVDLAGRRVPLNATTLRRARLADITFDKPVKKGGAA